MRWFRRLIVLLVLTFAVFYLVTRPQDAATAVRTLFGALGKAFSSIIVFFTSLAG